MAVCEAIRAEPQLQQTKTSKGVLWNCAHDLLVIRDAISAKARCEDVKREESERRAQWIEAEGVRSTYGLGLANFLALLLTLAAALWAAIAAHKSASEAKGQTDLLRANSLVEQRPYVYVDNVRVTSLELIADVIRCSFTFDICNSGVTVAVNFDEEFRIFASIDEAESFRKSAPRRNSTGYIAPSTKVPQEQVSQVAFPSGVPSTRITLVFAVSYKLSNADTAHTYAAFDLCRKVNDEIVYEFTRDEIESSSDEVKTRPNRFIGKMT